MTGLRYIAAMIDKDRVKAKSTIRHSENIRRFAPKVGKDDIRRVFTSKENNYSAERI